MQENGNSGVPTAEATQPLPCPTCTIAQDAGASTPVYAIGRIEARFPRLAVEKEFVQATGRTDTTGKTDRQAFHSVLSDRANRYLVRKLCWVMSVQGLETYLLQPRDPADFDLLVGAIRERPGPLDLDVVIGMRGPIAPPELCNGLMVPMVAFDQIYSFDRESLLKAIPAPTPEQDLSPAAEQVLDLIMQMTDNAGATDEHRALNYLAVRYPAIYVTAAEKFAKNMSLTGVELRPSVLSSTRNIFEVILSFNHRTTDVTEKMFARVDVTEEFPFLVTKMSPYYDR
jgi:hypothetical protein